MKIIGIIPARYRSTRFPGKPLAMIGDTSMIMRVYRQAGKVKQLHEVVVATDDKRIYNHVLLHNGKAVMTSPKHQSGTERCSEAIEKLSESFDIVINIQGDEPFIAPLQIRSVINAFKDTSTGIATLATPIANADEIFNPNTVKVVCNKQRDALFFSRNPIPYFRNPRGAGAPELWREAFPYLKHIGIYGYRTAILKQLTALRPVALEKTESLEQLRWMYYGFNLRVVQTTVQSIGIDTPEDLEQALKKLR